MYVVSTALLIYSHYYGVLTLLSHEAFWAITYLRDLFRSRPSRMRGRLRSWLLFHFVLILAYALWIPVAADKFLGFGSVSGGTSLVTIMRETTIVFFTGHSEAVYNAVPGDPAYFEDQVRAHNAEYIAVLARGPGVPHAVR
jgi:hypothetical protein